MYVDPTGHASSFGDGFAKFFRSLGMCVQLWLDGVTINQLKGISYNDLVILYNTRLNRKENPTDNNKMSQDYEGPGKDEHHGIDLVEYEGAPIYAAVGGQVITVVNSFEGQKLNTDGNDTFGNYIVIKDANGVQCFYAHLQQNSIKVSVGDYVIAGQTIGGMGNTGRSFGCHLHFAVYDGGWKNPHDYLP
jgi:murein DD-endopeptidase MepM/ murein hydrolase activator NlpD